MPQEGAEASIEDAGNGGEGQYPNLRLVPEVAYSDGVLRACAAGVVEQGDLR